MAEQTTERSISEQTVRAWGMNKENFKRNLAVIIGIDRYEHHPAIRNLTTPVRDAEAIAALLKKDYDYKPDDVISLTDTDATFNALIDLFETRLPKDLKPSADDRLIVYFAGHGLARSKSASSDDYGPEGYLVPHDADPAKEDSFLSMRRVSKALGELKCHHLLVILDCCFAGTFQWAGSRKSVPILEKIRREHYYHFIRHPSWQVITSSAHDQEALDVARLQEDNRQPVSDLDGSPPVSDSDGKHSPFALALLEGLKPGDDPQRVKADLFPDGIVTAHELFVYLQNRVKELSNKQQAPGIYPLRREYDRGEFVFTPPTFKPETLDEALPLNEDNNPYRGLNSFEEKHAEFFFGRQVLIEELEKRLAQPEQALTVVLGVSGSGKSSLVKAGLIPHLRNPKEEQISQEWYILNPMRPGELPFISLGRTLLPLVNAGLLEKVAQLSYLDTIFEPLLKARAVAKQNAVSEAQSQEAKANEMLIKVADSWCSAKPEAKLLLIKDYYAQLDHLGSAQEQAQLKILYNEILAELGSVSESLQKDPQFLRQAISTWSQEHAGVRLLLVIDQFEELLTRSQDDRGSLNQSEVQAEDRPDGQKEWQIFLKVLKIAIEAHPQTLRLMLTLRSDFEPRFLSSALGKDWNDARFPVRAMTSDELRQVIENPALKQALYFEELKDEKGNITGNLVSKLVDEVGQMPGALPLLSFTLSELYVKLYKRWQDDQSTDRTLLFSDYKVLGGVAGALTRRAAEQYNTLDEKHQATMRRVMLRMVAIEGGSVARRRVPIEELKYPSPDEDARVTKVIECLISARLVVKGQEIDKANVESVIYVEPAHDFLIRGWDKLQEWIKENQGYLVLRERLTRQADDWHKATLNSTPNKQDEPAIGLLWNNDPRLDQLKDISDLGMESWLNDLETEFVRSSLNQRRIVEEDLREQLQREKQLRITAELREKAAKVENLLPVNPKEALELAVQTIDQNLQNQKEGLLPQILTPVKVSLNKAMESVRLPNILVGHRGEVTSVAFSPDSQLIASASYNGTIYLWDLTGHPARSPIKGEFDTGLCAICFSPDGQFIVSGYGDGSIRLWTLAGESLSFPFQGHQGAVNSVAFSPDGQLIASGSEDMTIRVWNPQGELVREPFIGHNQEINSIAFSPTADLLVSGSKDGTIRIWELDANSESRVLNQDDWVSSVVFSPDGKLIAGASNLSGAYIKLKVWDVADGRCIEQLFKEDFGAFNSITFSPDGQWLVAGTTPSGGNNEILISGIRGNPVSQFFHQSGGEVNSITFSSDGKWLATGYRDGRVCLWDMHSSTIASFFKVTSSVYFSPDSKLMTFRVGDVRKFLRLPDLSELSLKIDFDGLVFSPDSKLIACRVDHVRKILCISDLSEFKIEIAFDDANSSSAYIEECDFSPDGSFVVCTYNNSRGVIWNTGDNSIRQTCEDAGLAGNLVLVSSDSNYVLVGNTHYGVTEPGDVCLWDLRENRVRTIFTSKSLQSINFSSDNRWIICRTSSLSYLGHQFYFRDLKGIPLSPEFQQHEQEEKGISTICISSDCQLIATAGSSMQIRLWNSEGKLLQVFPAKHQPFEKFFGIKSLAFSPDNRLIISLTLNSVYLWNLDGEMVCEPFESTSPHMSSLKFSDDGKIIIGFNEDRSHGINKVRLWNLEGKLIDQPYIREVDWIESLDFSPDGKQIVCGGYRGKMRVWDQDGNPLTQLFQDHAYRVAITNFSPDGQLIVSIDQQGTLYLRRSNWQSWFKICCDRLAYHLISENPELDLTKKIGASCFEYAWNKADVTQLLLRQAGDLSRQDKAEIAAIKLEQALETLLVACQEAKRDNLIADRDANSLMPLPATKKEILAVIGTFVKILSFAPPQLQQQKQVWFEVLNSTSSLLTSQELKDLLGIHVSAQPPAHSLIQHNTNSKSFIDRLRKLFASKD